MSKPAGAIDYSDGGLALPPYFTGLSLKPIKLVMSAPLIYNPKNYNESVMFSMKASAQIYQYDSAYIDGKNNTHAAYWAGPNTSATWSSKELAVMDYKTDRKDTTGDRYGDLDKFDFSFLEARLNFTNMKDIPISSTGTDAELLTLCFETASSDLDSDSTGIMHGKKFHNFGQGGTWSLTDKNMPCSAYLMKKILVENSNIIAYKNTTCFSVPL